MDTQGHEETLFGRIKAAENQVNAFLAKKEPGIAALFQHLVTLVDDIHGHMTVSDDAGLSSSALEKGLRVVEGLKMSLINAEHLNKR
jgi:DNA-binding phage protein